MIYPRIIKTGFCGFGSVTLIPIFFSKSPTNLNPGRKPRIKIKMMESDITDKEAIAFCFHRIKSVAKPIMLGNYTIIKLHRFFQRKTFGQIFHNLLVTVDCRKWKYIILQPRAQNKSLSFNHSNIDFNSSVINIVGVNSTI